MWVREPSTGIGTNTGIAIVMHGWGGDYRQQGYAENLLNVCAEDYNLISISVNYLQSGPEWPGTGGFAHPYDHGYLQAMDCLGAIYTVRRELQKLGIRFAERRMYAMGASGGGNIAQMAVKLAPHTFACGIDMCGMPGLIDEIAYGTGASGSPLNAMYSPDSESYNYLSADMKEIRDFGDLGHCRLLHARNPDLKIVIVHGVHDHVCPVVPKITQFRNMLMAGLDVDGHFLTEVDIDDVAVHRVDHELAGADKGNWYQIVKKYAGVYLTEGGTFERHAPLVNDFIRRGTIIYPTAGGEYRVDYADYPHINFIPQYK